MKYIADNYAWYAMARWVLATFKVTPDSSIASTSTAPADDFSDLFEDDRSDPEPVDYESIDYDEISSDEQIAFDAGDYTPNGWLQNKKLRILPLGGNLHTHMSGSLTDID